MPDRFAEWRSNERSAARISPEHTIGPAAGLSPGGDSTAESRTTSTISTISVSPRSGSLHRGQRQFLPAGLSRLRRRGRIRGRRTLRHTKRFAQSGDSSPCQGNQNNFRFRTESHRPKTSLGRRAAGTRLVSWHKENHLVASGDFQYLTDPHAPPKYWRNVEEGWFANVLPDMNQENPDVAKYFIDNALWWVEQTGIDGYRLDTFPYVSREFWSDWHQAVRQVYPHMTTVGEVMNGDPVITSFFVGGRARNDGIDSGVTTVFDYPFYYALREGLLENNSPARIVNILSQDHLYPHPEILWVFAGNHDVSRLAGIKDISLDKIKLAFSLVLTMRGTPELYYGDEIGMPGGNDPDNRRDFPGGFPGDKHNAFTQSGRTSDQQEIFSHVQKLLRLRNEHPALRHGQLWHIAWDHHCTPSRERAAKNAFSWDSIPAPLRKRCICHLPERRCKVRGN